MCCGWFVVCQVPSVIGAPASASSASASSASSSAVAASGATVSITAGAASADTAPPDSFHWVNPPAQTENRHTQLVLSCRLASVRSARLRFACFFCLLGSWCNCRLAATCVRVCVCVCVWLVLACARLPHGAGPVTTGVGAAAVFDCGAHAVHHSPECERRPYAPVFCKGV